MRKYNLKFSAPDSRDFKHVSFLKASILPKKFDLSAEMPPVLDQGSLGSCTSQSCSNILRHLLKKEDLPEFQPSRLYIYWNTRVAIEGVAPTEDSGCCIRDVCKALTEYHACDESFWPYDITKYAVHPPIEAYKNANVHTGISYYAIEQNLLSIKKALYEKFPIMFGIQIYESLETEEVMKTGIIPMPNTVKEQLYGGHCVTLTGYNDETHMFTLQNSWGNVGNHGFFNIPYDYVLNPHLASDFWVLNYFE